MTGEPIDETTAVQPELLNFYVTFGDQYRREPHPFFDGAHPDGYLKVMAPDELTARMLAFGLMDSAWSMLYTEHEFWKDPEDVERWYPLGELGQIGANTSLHPAPRGYKG